MNCSEVHQTLLLLVDDAEFPSNDGAAFVIHSPSPGRRRNDIQAADVKTHLATCVRCRGYLVELRRVQAILQQSHPPEFSNAYLDDFTRRALRQLPPKPGLWTCIKDWFLQLEQSPLPMVARGVAVLGTASVLALQIPVIESAVRILIGM